ncbi:hypothetical protein ES705_16418 [subsurface metagenome]
MAQTYEHEHDDKIIELRESGLSCAAAAEQLDIAHHAVQNCMRRLGLQGKFRGNQKDDKYIVKKPKKDKPGKPSPFSIIVEGDWDFINIRLLPTAKVQAQELVELLRQQGGEVIFERDLSI